MRWPRCLTKNETDLSDFFDRDFFRSIFDGTLGAELTAAGARSQTYYDAEKYLILIEVPGVPQEALNVQADNGTLTIEINHEFKEPRVREKITYKQSWQLPPEVDDTAIEAKLRNGILSVKLPRTRQRQAAGRTVEIKTD